MAEGKIPFQNRGKLASRYLIPALYLLAIALAEALTAFSNPQVGLALHGIIFVGIILHATLFEQGAQQKFLATLALAPLIRLMSLSLPLPTFPFVYWYAVVGAPLFLAAYLVGRMTGVKPSGLGLNLRIFSTVGSFLVQFMVGLSGFGLGILEYLILKPTPLASALKWELIWLPMLILVIFTGLLEEIVFRGLLQNAAIENLGRYGIPYVSLLFAVLHFGYRSAMDVLFVFAVGLFFAGVVAKTGSLIGVTVAHGLTNVVLFLIVPFVLHPATSPVSVIPATPTPPAVAAAVLIVSPGNPKTPTAVSSPSGVPATRLSVAFTSVPSAGSTETVPSLSTSATSTPSPSSLPPQSPPTVPLAPIITPVIVDDGDTGYLGTGSKWWLSEVGFAGDFHIAFAISGEADSTTEWHPELVACGVYDLEVYIPARFATTQAAHYQIGYRQGITERILNQAANQGRWVSVGFFEFQPGSGTFLRLTNASGESISLWRYIIFDAARWSYVSPCAMETPGTP